MIRWALFSTLAAGLFYGLYCLLLRRDRWLQLSRVYLLTTLAFSLVYPLVRMPEVELPLPTFGGEATLPMLEFTADDTPTAEPTADMTAPRNGLKMLPIAYIIGVVVSLLVLAVQLLRTTISIRRVSSQARRQRIRLHLTDDSTPPYSLFNHIVIGTNGLDEEQLQCILAHEALHVRQRHTLDVLMARLICCTAWFNPFAWLYVRELRAVHEYLADGAVLADHGREGYLGLLYREATGIGYGHITNNFHSINLKKRITMMNRKKSRFGAWKLLAALPVAAMLMAFGCRTDGGGGNETGGLDGNTLITVNYHKAGGKRLPFIGLGYLTCHSKLDLVGEQWVGSVTCQGEGWGTSYHNWELSEFTTSKGRTNGRVLNRYEKRLINDIDRQLRDGKAEGMVSRTTTVRADGGRTVLAFTATWSNGNRNGDADITLTVREEAAIPDGVYASHDYIDCFKDGRLVSREYRQIEVPLEELMKVEMVIGSKDKIARAMENLADGYYYLELNQMHPDAAYPQNRNVDLWELCITNDFNTWLARKKAGLEFYTEPEFEGGTEALASWLQANIHYPEEARRDSISGMVLVGFIIEADGSIGAVELMRGPAKAAASLEEEALRVVKAMPRWKPATFMDKVTRARYFLPIRFKL